MDRNIILIVGIVVFLSITAATFAVNTIPIYVRPLNASGAIVNNTAFNYTFNFTNDSGCTQVLLSKTNNIITTDLYGIGFIELDVSGITYPPTYLCEYRDNSLRKAHNISVIFAEKGIIRRNVTAEYYFGSGAFLTDLNATGNVTSNLNITDNSIVKGDGGGIGIQNSSVLIDDSGNIRTNYSIYFGNQYIKDATNTLYVVSQGNYFHKAVSSHKFYNGGGAGTISFAISTTSVLSYRPIYSVLNSYYKVMAKPANVANYASVYVKDVGAIANLFTANEAGVETQLSGNAVFPANVSVAGELNVSKGITTGESIIFNTSGTAQIYHELLNDTQPNSGFIWELNGNTIAILRRISTPWAGGNATDFRLMGLTESPPIFSLISGAGTYSDITYDGSNMDIDVEIGDIHLNPLNSGDSVNIYALTHDVKLRVGDAGFNKALDIFHDGTDSYLEVTSGDINIKPTDTVNIWGTSHNAKLRLGSAGFAQALDIWHDGTNAWIDTTTGQVIIPDDVNITKNLTANLYYGEMWVHNDTAGGYVVDVGSSNDWVNITGFNESINGQTLNGVTYTVNENKLTCIIPGLYDMTIDISTGNSGNNEEYQFTLAINNVPDDSIDAHHKLGAGGDVASIAARGFVRCNNGDEITLQTRDVDGTSDLNVHAASVHIIRIGD